MAHSSQIYKNRTTTINDLDLLAIIGLAMEIIRRSPDFIEFNRLAAYWQKSMSGYGPGIINLRLDEFVVTPDEKRKFLALLSAVFEKTSQYGQTIPADVLNRLMSTPGPVIYSDNYKIAYIEEAIQKIKALIVSNS